MRTTPVAIMVALTLLQVHNLASAQSCDAHGSKNLFPSARSSFSLVGSWTSNWYTKRSMSVNNKDPKDAFVYVRGSSGSMEFDDGIAEMSKNPRMYVQDPNGRKWNNLEITVWGKRGRDSARDPAGFTIMARSNHNLYRTSPCQAQGYYFRWYFSSGELSFQKEFYHKHKGSVVYSATDRTPFKKPSTKWWYGMKFVLQTKGTGVLLTAYIDDTTQGRDGGNWRQVHQVFDNGRWKATKSFHCSGVSSTQVFRNPGNVVALRTDNVDSLYWRDMTIREIDPNSGASCLGSSCRCSKPSPPTNTGGSGSSPGGSSPGGSSPGGSSPGGSSGRGWNIVWHDSTNRYFLAFWVQGSQGIRTVEVDCGDGFSATFHKWSKEVFISNTDTRGKGKCPTRGIKIRVNSRDVVSVDLPRSARTAVSPRPRVVLTLNYDIDSIPENSIERSNFVSTLTGAISIPLRCDPDRVVVDDVQAGSVVATVIFLPPMEGTSTRSATALARELVTLATNQSSILFQQPITSSITGVQCLDCGSSRDVDLSQDKLFGAPILAIVLPVIVVVSVLAAGFTLVVYRRRRFAKNQRNFDLAVQAPDDDDDDIEMMETAKPKQAPRATIA